MKKFIVVIISFIAYTSNIECLPLYKASGSPSYQEYIELAKNNDLPAINYLKTVFANHGEAVKYAFIKQFLKKNGITLDSLNAIVIPASSAAASSSSSQVTAPSCKPGILSLDLELDKLEKLKQHIYVYKFLFHTQKQEIIPKIEEAQEEIKHGIININKIELFNELAKKLNQSNNKELSIKAVSEFNYNYSKLD